MQSASDVLQSCAGIVISMLVASTLVSATQFLKALYVGGLKLDSNGLRPSFNNLSISVATSSSPAKDDVTPSGPTNNHTNVSYLDM